jgi:hypothetical protein
LELFWHSRRHSSWHPPDTFAREIIHSYLSGKPKGKMAKIEQSYVEREMERRKQPAIPQHL